MANINNSVISQPEVVNINREDYILQLMPIASLQVQNICITQGFQGDDDPIVPPN
ncbi:MAG: hypothetical protein HEQ24_03590 [Dolichospermum sp. BR01]|nr:hypothetical protein [Dolichospermum sp. BR01]